MGSGVGGHEKEIGEQAHDGLLTYYIVYGANGADLNREDDETMVRLKKSRNDSSGSC